MDDHYAINVAKTEMREAYRNADVNAILALIADDFTDMREGQATFWGVDAKAVFRAHLEKLFREHEVELTPIIIDVVISGDLSQSSTDGHRRTHPPKAGGKQR